MGFFTDGLNLETWAKDKVGLSNTIDYTNRSCNYINDYLSLNLDWG